MSFMRGPAPVRRTLQYLEKGRLVFKDRVKIMSLNFNTAGRARDRHEGMQEFVFWFLPQVLYKNPDVQVVLFKNKTPTPFARFWLEDGNEVIMDVDGKSKEEILNQMLVTLGKTTEQLQKEALMREKKDTPANFGRHYDKFCICEVPGQVPCPGIVPLPKSMRGKCRAEQER
uniref:Small ribosomal subunit protein mS25 n=1 Tax=Rhipicephalus microplus TaxID=6941 RepID=A0A6M2CS35_RHIMP